MRHLHLQHRRTPSFGRALLLSLLVASVYRAQQEPDVEDEDDVLPDLEEPEPLDDDDWDEDDDEWDDEEAEPFDDEEGDEFIGTDDYREEHDPGRYPPTIGGERIW